MGLSYLDGKLYGVIKALIAEGSLRERLEVIGRVGVIHTVRKDDFPPEMIADESQGEELSWEAFDRWRNALDDIDSRTDEECRSIALQALRWYNALHPPLPLDR